MSIIGKVGRKSIKIRLLNISIHTILLIGTITMIYPFMIMVSSSFKSHVDSRKFSIYPEFFFNEEMLFKKYVEARYNEESGLFLEQYKNRYLSFEFLEKPSDSNQQKFADWQEFQEEFSNKYSVYDFYIAEQFGRGIYPKNERVFRQKIKKECDKSLEVFNRKYQTGVTTWEEVRVEEKGILFRNFTGDYQNFLKRYEQFREKVPFKDRLYASLDGHFLATELIPTYRGKLEILNQKLGTDFADWKNIYLTRKVPDSPLKKHWVNYVKNTLNIHHIGIEATAFPKYRKFLQEKYSNIELLNETYKTSYQDFSEITIPENLPRTGAVLVDLTFFIENIIEPEYLYLKSVEFDYRDWLKAKYGSIAEINRLYEKGFSTFERVKLSAEFPKYNLNLQNDWADFIKKRAADTSLSLLMTSQKEFLDFMRENFPSENGELDLDSFNETYNTNFNKEMNIYPAKKLPVNPEYQQDWLKFVRETVSSQFLKIDSEKEADLWLEFLREKYQTIEKLNTNYGLVYTAFNEIEIDHWSFDYLIFKQHKKVIFREFVKRNYAMVLDVMLYNGHAIMNTLIYCFLAIVTALIINPLAAYAMSRFKLKATYKIILVLMLTMAFPPMVMGIPNFLLLKKLNFLNTFFALILPGAADGYFIFLLKGFFDSLPKELFESATIDGASEHRIFWQIAMSLSKPIMAVIALGAFNAAYRNFMFAFIVCQDKSMWTMMVHIYQLMQRSCAGVGFSALVIAAVPTFIVFVFFQNIIIKGIVVPTEK